jgi:hypothetical protein
MDYNFISEIIDKLDKLRDIEYKKANYKPSNKILYIKKRKNPNKETIDLKKFKSNVSNTIYKYRNKNKDKTMMPIEIGNDIQNDNNNIYNLYNGKTEVITWRKLTVDERTDAVIKYFSSKNLEHKNLYQENLYSEKLMNEFIELVRNKKIQYKKQLHYDELNCRIVSIPCLVYDEKINEYKYIVSQKKIKKKSAKEMFK